jgi:hypothetical protein
MVAEVPCYLAENEAALEAASLNQAARECRDMRQKLNHLLSLDQTFFAVNGAKIDELRCTEHIMWQKRSLENRFDALLRPIVGINHGRNVPLIESSEANRPP